MTVVNTAEKRPLTVSRNALLESDGDARFRQLVYDLLAMLARIDTVRNEYGKAIDLTGIQYTILISVSHLSEHGEVNINTLANQLRLSGAFVTIETGKLAKLGLINKTKDPKDRRRVNLKITGRGKQLLVGLAPIQQEVNDVLFESLTEDDFQLLCGIAGDLVGCGDRAVTLINYLRESAV